MQLASAEQLRTFIDLDAWHRDQPDVSRVLLWLRAARGAGGKRWLRKLHGLDIELFELLLRERLQVHDLTEEEEPPETERATFTTFDLRLSHRAAGRPGGRQRPAAARHRPLRLGPHLRAAHSHRRALGDGRRSWPSRLSAGAPRGSPTSASPRSRRPSRSTPGSSILKAPPPPTELPVEVQTLPVAGQKLPSLLQQAMAALPVDEAGRVQAGLVLLGNAALVADGVDPSDANRARAVLERVAATLSLGLSELSSNEVAAAARILLDVAFKRIFQVGFTQTLKLQWAAEKARWAGPMATSRQQRPPARFTGKRSLRGRRQERGPSSQGRSMEQARRIAPSWTPLDVATVRMSIEHSITLSKVVVAAGVVPEEVARLYEPHLGLHPLASLRFSDLPDRAGADAGRGRLAQRAPHADRGRRRASHRVCSGQRRAEGRRHPPRAGAASKEVAHGIEPDGYGCCARLLGPLPAQAPRRDWQADRGRSPCPRPDRGT